MDEKKQIIIEQIDEYSKKLKKIDNHKELIDNSAYSELEKSIKLFKEDSLVTIDEHRLMRIGVIGQIKRGKSSFLNSFFFDGKRILPEGATPMTAALTKINYSKEIKAEIEFYTKKEWSEILIRAAKKNDISKRNEEIRNNLKKKKNAGSIIENISEDLEIAAELVKNVNSNNIDIDKLLDDKKKTIDGIIKIGDLVGRLDDYVGADGKFTPLVKSMNLSLNIERLKNIEIVDTPGMNDPIISRVARTKEHIGQCDVIFLLSYSAQFLDSSDMELLSQNIPSRGILDIVIIGSMIDSVLFGEHEKYKSLGKALNEILNKKKKEAENNFNNIKNNISKKSFRDSLDKAFPPTFISSRCYNIAKHFDNITEAEEQTLANLNSMFDDFTFDKKALNDLSNFDEINEKFELVKMNKDEILSNRYKEVLEGFREGFKIKLEQIKKNLNQKKEKLEIGDIETLKKEQNGIINRIISTKKKVDAVFEKHTIEAEKKFEELRNEIENVASDSAKIHIIEGKDIHEKKISNAKWYNPFTWFSSEMKIVTTAYTYANIHDAVEMIEEYVRKCKKDIRKAIKDIINIKEFKVDITDSIMKVFDTSADNFDLDDVMIPVENAVNRITIPDVHIEVGKHIETVRNKFKASKVINDEIDSLRREQGRVVNLLTNDIKKEVNGIVSKTKKTLDDIKKSFIPEITGGIEKMVEEVKEQLKDKEKSLKSYEELLNIIENMEGK